MQTLNRIGLKPLLEWVSPGLDQITFSIAVSALLGISPRQKLDFWRALAAAGTPDVLVIGNVPVSTSNDEWIVTNVQENWITLDAQGNVIYGTIALTFEEYVTS